MKRFNPSTTFVSYYNTVVAAATGPMGPGMGHLAFPIPAGLSAEEQAFAETKLANLIAAVNSYRDAVNAAAGLTSGPSGTIGELAAQAEAGDPAAQLAYEQLLWQQASSGAP